MTDKLRFSNQHFPIHGTKTLESTADTRIERDTITSKKQENSSPKKKGNLKNKQNPDEKSDPAS